MIKNPKQAGVSKEKLEQLNRAKRELQNKESELSAVEFTFGINSLDGMIKGLEHDLWFYNALVKGDVDKLDHKVLEDIAEIFIAGRLAKNLSHKELAERLGLKESQIQRYEATNYESASLVRLFEIADALEIELKFAPINLIDCKIIRFPFLIPENGKQEEVDKFARSVQANGLISL